MGPGERHQLAAARLGSRVAVVSADKGGGDAEHVNHGGELVLTLAMLVMMVFVRPTQRMVLATVVVMGMTRVTMLVTVTVVGSVFVIFNGF